MAPPWELRGRGLKDSLRHDQRVKEAIRKNLRELISEEAIITSDGQRTVRIPIRYLEQYKFKYGTPQNGVGQGEGKPGDVLGRRGDGLGSGDGMPGDQPGELTYEVDVPLDELVAMMLEDLALPWLEEKPERIIIAESFEMTERRHLPRPISRIDIKRTLKANVKRNAIQHHHAKVDTINEQDIYISTWEEKEEAHTNAAVYMLMDRSGSMTTSKKYVAKSFFFWMVRFLRLKYQRVETVFIAHDTEAAVVPEQDFFALSNDGGTRCSSAYKMALDHIALNHPASRWNIYVFHFSDGDNLPYDNAVCKTLVQDLLVRCNMLGYGQIQYEDESFYHWRNQLSLTESSLQHTLGEITNPRLLSVTITHKEELYAVLQKFLQPQEEKSV